MRISFDTFENLNSLRDPSRLSVGEFPLLVNGRTRSGLVDSIQSHEKITSPYGKHQFIGCVGQYLLVIVNGVLYIKDVVNNGSFFTVENWYQMDRNVDYIYAAIVPLGSSVVGFASNDPTASTSEVLPIPTQSPNVMVFTDGIMQPQIATINGYARLAKTLNRWSKSNPEYMPIMSYIAVSGSKLYGVSADKLAIYHSVSGRPLDFAINVNSAGVPSADGAKSTQKAVDYNTITGILPVADGGLIVSTLYSTYLLSLDTSRKMWGEPFLQDSLLFDSGMVNHLSFANLNGEIALITQAGIQSISNLAQNRQETKINVLSAAIGSLIYGTQQNTCACNFQNLALFAIETRYGPMVAVYDSLIGAWVSFDQFPDRVKKFAVMKYAGTERLFFITHNDQLYEAYSGSTAATLRLLTPNFVFREGGLFAHRATHCKVSLANVTANGKVKVTYIGDTQNVQEAAADVTATTPTPSYPYPFGVDAYTDAVSLEFAIANAKKVRSSAFLVESSVAGSISEVVMEYSKEEKERTRMMADVDEVTVGVFNGFKYTESPYSLLELATEITVGHYYLIDGICTDGEFTYTNQYFKARKALIAIQTGVLFKLGYESMAAISEMLETCDEVYCVSRYFKGPYLSAMFADKRVKVAMDPASTSSWTPTVIAHYFEQDYYQLSANGVFLMDCGRYGIAPPYTPYIDASIAGDQFRHFKSHAGWMAVVGDYIYAETDARAIYENTALRWPFNDYDTKLVVQPGEYYFRRRVNNVEYVGIPGIQGAGYDGQWLRIKYTAKFGIKVEQVTPSGVVDTYTIHL